MRKSRPVVWNKAKPVIFHRYWPTGYKLHKHIRGLELCNGRHSKFLLFKYPKAVQLTSIGSDKRFQGVGFTTWWRCTWRRRWWNWFPANLGSLFHTWNVIFMFMVIRFRFWWATIISWNTPCACFSRFNRFAFACISLCLSGRIGQAIAFVNLVLC